MWFLPLSLSESASIFLILTNCFFGIMANFDINVYIIANILYTNKLNIFFIDCKNAWRHGKRFL